MIDLSGIDILGLIGRDTQLKRAANSRGGVWQGPCPFCGGKDRFSVWPNHLCGKGKWHCIGGKGCDKRGDAIDYLKERDGLTYRAALDALGVDGSNYGDGPRPLPRPRPPKGVTAPSPTWQGRGRRFCEECKATLWAPGGAKALDWLRGRGLSDETIKSASLGYNAADLTEDRATWGLETPEVKPGERKPRGVWLPRGVVIPWEIDGELWRVNVRRPVPAKSKDKYRGPAGWGGGSPLYNAGALTIDKPAMMVEGELDALTLAQVAGNLVTPVATGSTTGARRARWIARLALCPAVLVSFDADEGGEGAAPYWLRVLDNARRWRPYWGDANAMATDGADVRGWVEAALDDESEMLGQPAPIPQEIPDPDGYQDLLARLDQVRHLPDVALIGDIEAAMVDHLAVMGAATGCDDSRAEFLAVQFDHLSGLYGEALILPQARADPPPSGVCGVHDSHRRYWRRPGVGGWVCVRCHPPVPGAAVELYEVPGDDV
ncbi:MAG: hypothetical protein GY832_23525 [Chloroflexi bacterium]|nr:hypothetical protein [Chloroflexota bacterium]